MEAEPLDILELLGVVEESPTDPLALKFRDFHRKNPKVYDQLRELALKMRRTGRKKYGIKSLFEVLRWHRALATTDDDFKLNNNYTAYYARLLMEKEPELQGFFDLRKSRGDTK